MLGTHSPAPRETDRIHPSSCKFPSGSIDMILDEIVGVCLVEYSLEQVVSKFRDGISSSSRISVFGKVILQFGGWFWLSDSPDLLTTGWISIRSRIGSCFADDLHEEDLETSLDPRRDGHEGLEIKVGLIGPAGQLALVAIDHR
jgi:hypothetical protein